MNIHSFMKCYRETFPKASVIVKMHILEDHMVGWMNKWKVGFGLMGEQGVESIHGVFNQLQREYCNVRNGPQRCQAMMEEHHRRCHPTNKQLVPKARHRTTSTN